MKAVIFDGDAVARWRYHAREAGGNEGAVDYVLRYLEEHAPDFSVVCFDGPRNWRNTIFPDYKLHRAPTPDDYLAELRGIPAILDACGIGWACAEGFESDDLIAAYVAKLPVDAKITIVSSDKDLCQLVRPGVTVYDPVPWPPLRQPRWFTPEAVRQRFGVEARRLREFLAIRGDTSDGVPGVPGWGDTTAARAINETEDFEHLLVCSAALALLNVPEVKQRALNANKTQLETSYRLVELRADAPVVMP